MRALLLPALAGLLLAAGCGGNVILDSGAGGSGAGGAGAGGSTSSGGPGFSCDIHMSGTHECVEFLGLPPADAPAVKSSCAAAMGTEGTGCPSAGQLGTCTSSMTGLGVPGVTEAIVFYAGAGLTPFEAQQACTSDGGTWSPAG